MRKPHSLVALLLFAVSTSVAAQTNPTAVTLPFALNSQSSATLPAGVAVHRYSAIQTTRTVAPATGDLPNQGSTPTGNAGGWYHLGADGIGLLASGTNPAGAVVVAINTTGISNVSVSWICKTIYNQASRDNSVALQYRIGTSGNFTQVGTASTYASTGNANGHTSATFTEVLPAGADNQPVVQVRWIYWESTSTSGSRDKIAVDNISIAGSGTTTCAAPNGLIASGITTTAANLGWNTVAGALAYEYAVTTSATPPSSGTNTATNAVTATGLTAGTNYYLHLRTVCSTEFSGWATLPFSTLPDPSEDDEEFVLMTYNLLNYPGSNGASRESAYRTIVSEVQPDILVVQELSSPSGISSFLSNVLNFSTSTYSQGTFINGPDSDNGIYYKSAEFQFISNTPIQTDLRDISQFKLRHLPTGDTLIIFSAHLKASDTAPDEAQRADEVDSLRKVTNALGTGKYFVVCGDFNIYRSSEAAYQKLVTNGVNANGRFNDIISMSGTWNNASYAINHTQSPRTTAFGGGATGGMDDRFDLILFSEEITQPGGFDIVSNSYKAFGNDGAHYNQALNTPPYTTYSSTTAAALHDASDHLPVIVKLSYTSGSLRKTAANMPVPNQTANVRIYPNPANTMFFVEMTTDGTATGFELCDVNGTCIRKSVLEGLTGAKISFDVTGLAAGIYYLRAGNSGDTYKIVVQK
jgi:endonuclease/exonuclease/phosphatase family metal-dependent hydrolase